MKVIKDNTKKGKRIKCKFCKSKIIVTPIDLKKDIIGCMKWCYCPCCGNKIWID